MESTTPTSQFYACVIDDEPLILTGVEKILAENNLISFHTIDTALTASEGMERLQAFYAQIKNIREQTVKVFLLSDWKIKNDNGLALIEQAKKLLSDLNPFTVLMTANQQGVHKQLQEKDNSYHPNLIMSKPFGPDELNNVLEKFLEFSQNNPSLERPV